MKVTVNLSEVEAEVVLTALGHGVTPTDAFGDTPPDSDAERARIKIDSALQKAQARKEKTHVPA